jgi:hypothetical protein
MVSFHVRGLVCRRSSGSDVDVAVAAAVELSGATEPGVRVAVSDLVDMEVRRSRVETVVGGDSKAVVRCGRLNGGAGSMGAIFFPRAARLFLLLELPEFDSSAGGTCCAWGVMATVVGGAASPLGPAMGLGGNGAECGVSISGDTRLCRLAASSAWRRLSSCSFFVGRPRFLRPGSASDGASPPRGERGNMLEPGRDSLCGSLNCAVGFGFSTRPDAEDATASNGRFRETSAGEACARLGGCAIGGGALILPNCWKRLRHWAIDRPAAFNVSNQTLPSSQQEPLPLGGTSSSQLGWMLSRWMLSKRIWEADWGVLGEYGRSLACCRISVNMCT